MKIAIIGAGISGLISAYLLSNKNCKIDIFESRKNEIGGNCFDELTSKYYYQKYGPHIFHTNNKNIWDFLNKFSTFEPYQHKVCSLINGNLKNIPLHTNEIQINKNKDIYKNAEDFLISSIGENLTNKYFKYYSEKQWGCKLSNLPVEVVNRIPINEIGENRYFPKDHYQGIPSEGFTILCNNLLKSIKNVNLIYKKVNENIINSYDLVILTGRIDEFYKYKFGKLSYRYINFEKRIIQKETYQEYAVINYPNDYDFTRITEYNHFLKNKKFKLCCLGLEYPSDNEQYEPCYPIFWDKESQNKFELYSQLDKKVVSIGRLGSFKYMNIDKVIENTFDIIGKL